jgi:hypothetical protein
MPELPGEPRLQLPEGCRAGGGGAIRQKDFLGFISERSDNAHFIRPGTQELHRYAHLAQAISGAGFLSGGCGIQ